MSLFATPPSSVFSLPLVCTRCGECGSDPVCGAADAAASVSASEEAFHVFADERGVVPGSSSKGETDVTTHVINLDAPPEERWSHIMPLYADAMRALIPVIKRELTHKAHGFAEAVAELARTLPERFEFARELDGIAAQTGIDVATLMAGNLWLETGGMGCSTMVSSTNAGQVGGEDGVQVPFLIRTMDWQIPEFRIGTLQLKFARRGKVLFIATTHTGFIGTITAASSSFGISVNHRREEDVHGDKPKRRQAQLARVVDGTRLGLAPVSFFVRELMERASTYEEAVALSQSTDLMAPCYINLIGTVAGEGCVISRAPMASQSSCFPVWQLAARGPTCQTNSDIFDAAAAAAHAASTAHLQVCIARVWRKG